MTAKETILVPENRWEKAQKWEKGVWIKSNKGNSYLKIVIKFIKSIVKNPKVFLNYLKYRDFYCGDDWNFWWMDKFEGYKALPKCFKRALEVGCGPYTNVRLISKVSDIKEIYCSDPLINVYISFKLTWLSGQFLKRKINISSDSCESIKSKDNFYDLLICINVLDHVQDASSCLREILRVIKKDGFFVFGQDLTSEEDLINVEVKTDVGHPIKISHTTIEDVLKNNFTPRLKKILPRDEGRNPKAHYATYIFIGQKK